MLIRVFSKALLYEVGRQGVIIKMSDNRFHDSVYEANKLAEEMDGQNALDLASIDADVAAEDARLAAEKARADEARRLEQEALEAEARRAEEERRKNEEALKKMQEEQEALRLAKLQFEKEKAEHMKAISDNSSQRTRTWVEELFPDGLCCGARSGDGIEQERDRAEMKALLQAARSAAFADKNDE